jgi:putative GTP pyrophosphokinase
VTQTNGEAYLLVRPLYQRFADRLADLLGSLLLEAAVRVHTIDHRAKDVESFLQKASRPEKNYKDPLKDITDLAGVRVIAYHIDDLIRIGALIRQEFIVDDEQSSDRGAILKPNEFGYRSHHFVVKLTDRRSNLSEWKPLADLVAEIQARTVLQHAWAAISHGAQYKSRADLPPALSRRMFRVSGGCPSNC